LSLSSPSSTQNGFSVGTDSATLNNGAGRGAVVRSSMVVLVAGLVALLC
jgi:hypothetical protein